MHKLFPIFICFLVVIPCQAKIIYVDDDGPADFNNIQTCVRLWRALARTS